MWSGETMANSLETHHNFPITILLISTLISQLGITIGGYIYDRGKCGSGKYGVIFQNPPIYTGHNNPEYGTQKENASRRQETDEGTAS